MSFLEKMECDSYDVVAQELRAKKYERIVFVNGCFDVIHVGHVSTLEHAKKLAGRRGGVVVGLNSDESVRRLKGESRPVFSQNDRATVLMAMRFVDHVAIFGEDTPLKLIKSIRPDIIVKGGDYLPEQVIGKELSIVVIAPFRDGLSTTNTLEKINGRIC